MMLTLQDLRTTFPKAGVIISGDRNDLITERLLSIDTSLRQIVTRPTRGQNTLDIILTDLAAFYEDPIIVNPIGVDPDKKGVPSDHMGVVVNPISGTGQPVRRKKFVKTVRPITSSSLLKIGQVLNAEEWQFMIDAEGSPTQLTESLQNYANFLLDKFCPQKQVFYRKDDVPFITEEIKILKRKIMREYEKKGKTQKYFTLKSQFSQKLQNERIKYRQKLEDEVISGDRTSVYAA